MKKRRQQAKPPEKPRARFPTWAPACVLVAAAFIAYANTLHVPFVFDDATAIPENTTIRSLLPLSRSLHGPDQSTVAGRPVVNFSLALNYAVAGLSLPPLHLANIAIHALAAMALYGVARRTLAGPRLRGRFGDDAAPLAFGIALIWTLHPIQTESVTYVVQRAESLLGLFYLLTLHCFIRSADGESPRSRRLWGAGAVLACALGMGSKEVMATAPLTVLIYDALFLAPTPKDALTRPGGLHAALWSTLAILFWLVHGGPRSQSAGFGLETSTPMQYFRTQMEIIPHYLRLCLWPDPLVIDYWWPVAKSWTQVLPGFALLAALGGLTAAGLWRRRPAAFLGAWFFLILGPTSSFMPIADLAFEHRMYLPLAALAAFAVLAIHEALRRAIPDAAARRHAGLVILIGLAAALGLATLRRNYDYRTERSLWEDVVAKRPSNPRGHNNLGSVLLGLKKPQEAISVLTTALKLRPDYADAHYNMGNALADLGRPSDAIPEYEESIRRNPLNPKPYNNLGSTLADLGRRAEGEAKIREAIHLSPGYADAHNNLATILAETGRLDEAIEHFAEASRLDPAAPNFAANLARARADRAARGR